jgi:hypothetical protein
MSSQNPRITVNQTGARIGIESVENLTADQICGSRNSGQKSRGVQPEIKPPTANTRPRRSIAIGVTVNPDAEKQAKTDSIADAVGDFVEALISGVLGL